MTPLETRLGRSTGLTDSREQTETFFVLFSLFKVLGTLGEKVRGNIIMGGISGALRKEKYASLSPGILAASCAQVLEEEKGKKRR